MANKEVIIIGGSAGSINVVLKILPLLKNEIKLPLILVLHRKAGEENILESLLQFKSKLKVTEVMDKMPVENNVVYLAPANYHLLIEKEKIFMLDDSEKVNYSRPNIDVTMESAIEVYHEKVIGILLTGANNDGAAGLKKIKEAGGITIIQSPETCLFPNMPQYAAELCKPNFSMTPEEIAQYIINLKN